MGHLRGLRGNAGRTVALLVVSGLGAATTLTACGEGGPSASGSSASAPAAAPPVGPSGPAPSERASSAPTVSTAGPPTLSAEVVQYRRDAQRGVVQVKVTNHGTVPVRVDRVGLSSTTLTAEASAAKDSLVGAGLSVDLTVPLAPADCTSPGEDVGPGTDEVRLRVQGTTLTLPVDDAVLRQVRDRRCTELAVGDVVDLAFDPTWVAAGLVGEAPAARGRLVADPADGVIGTVLLEGATTLFTVEGVSTGDLDGSGAVALDVVVTVTRCDAHAVAEDKKGYLFPVRVRADELDDVRVEVAVPVPERAPLQALIDRTCR